jgi:ribosomal protein S18 acetylase RimI-like enzyme
MIKEITFEEIRKIWEKYLWAEYVKDGYTINPINLTSQKNYCLSAVNFISNLNLLAKIIRPTYIGYFLDDKIIGVESGYKTSVVHYRLRGLWVHEDHRHKGIATKLIRYLEDRCRKPFLWTIPRESALDFYLKYGFKVDGKSAKTIYGQNYFAIKENDTQWI